MDPMTDETETTPRRRSTDGSTPPVTRRKRLSAVVDAITTPVPFWVIGVLIVLGAVVSLALDASRRETARQSTLQAIYFSDLRDYDNALQLRSDCVEAVGRSDLNRGQHEATVEAFDKLFTMILPDIFGFGPETVAGLNQAAGELTAELEAGPLLAAQPRTIAECPAAPDPPLPPPGLRLDGVPPTLITGA